MLFCQLPLSSTQWLDEIGQYCPESSIIQSVTDHTTPRSGNIGHGSKDEILSSASFFFSLVLAFKKVNDHALQTCYRVN